MAVGPVYTGDGSTPVGAPRQGRLSEAIVGQAHGKYYEAASRSAIYAGSNAVKRDPLAALATSASVFGVFNPAGSTKRLSLLKASYAQAATGTQGTGALMHCVATLNGPIATQGGTIPTGTAVVPLNQNLGSSNSSVASAFELIVLHTTAPVSLYPFANLSQSAGGTISANHEKVVDDVDGAIILEPGGIWCAQGITAAGTGPLVFVGAMWEEVLIG
jgi:hypothetical protein